MCIRDRPKADLFKTLYRKTSAITRKSERFHFYLRIFDTKNPVQSAERIFQVVEMLADHGEMGLMEISTALGLHKSTVHRLLTVSYTHLKRFRAQA